MIYPAASILKLNFGNFEILISKFYSKITLLGPASRIYPVPPSTVDGKGNEMGNAHRSTVLTGLGLERGGAGDDREWGD